MAPTSSRRTAISPYYFGINILYLAFTIPVFYFLCKTLDGIFFLGQPFACLPASKSNSPPRTVSSNICRDTEAQYISIYNNFRDGNDAGKALLACLLATFVYLVAGYSESKWNKYSEKARWSYQLYVLKWYHCNRDQESVNWIFDVVPPLHDYRISQRSEATNLLFLVAMSACLCPIAEFLLSARQGVSDRLYKQEGGSEETDSLRRGLLMIYLIFRYGTLPCFLTGLVSMVLTGRVFYQDWKTRLVTDFWSMDWTADASTEFWYMWIEKWAKAHQMENGAAEAKWMAEYYDIVERGDGDLHYDRSV